MAATERVTVTLPSELLEGIDRVERNRSRFITMAVGHELDRLRREALLRSLATPHAESVELAEQGLHDWASAVPDDDAASLVDVAAGTAVHWTPDMGWREERS